MRTAAATMDVQASEFVNLPMARVWDFIVDLSHLALFQPHLRSVRLVEGRHGEVGAVYEQHARAGVASVRSRVAVCGVEPGSRLAWSQGQPETTGATGEAEVQAPETMYLLSPEGQGTRVELRARYAARRGRDGVGGWLNPGFLLQKLALKAAQGGADRRAEGYLGELKQHLESQLRKTA